MYIVLVFAAFFVGVGVIGRFGAQREGKSRDRTHAITREQ
jgi:hypothetical protein